MRKKKINHQLKPACFEPVNQEFKTNIVVY